MVQVADRRPAATAEPDRPHPLFGDAVNLVVRVDQRPGQAADHRRISDDAKRQRRRAAAPAV